MKIYDTFIYFNERRLLEMRLELLLPHVDYVVICEALQDFRGRPRNLELSGYRLHPKIRIVVCTLPDYGTDDYAASQRENYQRDQLMLGITDAAPDDLILFGDADEIPNPDKLQTIKEATETGPVKLQQYLSYYNPCWRANELWYGTTAARRKHFQSFVELRNRTIQDTPYIPLSGWHMSYNGTLSEIEQKLDSFAHADLVRPYAKRENVVASMEHGADLFNRSGVEFYYTEYDNTFPHNIKRWYE